MFQNKVCSKAYACCVLRRRGAGRLQCSVTALKPRRCAGASKRMNVETHLIAPLWSQKLSVAGMFEGMAAVEADAYRVLRQLGASPLKEVLTAGGGAANPKWTALRAAALGVPVSASKHGDASYGAALLACSGARLAAGGK